MVSPIDQDKNPFDADKHLRHFAEFCQGVMWAGGTTPHMLMTVKAMEGHDFRTALWRAGCYGFVYNYATAEVLWRNWRPGEWKHDELVGWFQKHWKGIKLRKERKAVRSPEKLATNMRSYADWMDTVQDKAWFADESLSAQERYYQAFDDMCDNIKYYGRYIVIRLIEVFRRAYALDMPQPDLRPRDGDHPRKALALMYPEYIEELMGGNDEDTISIVNDVVEFAREDLWNLYHIDVDYYTMQSLLCEYKQSVLSGRQYPGKSVDTALAYFSKVYDYWGEEEAAKTEMWDIREAIFPHWILGEKQGWDGVRNVLGETLRTHGYTWSDKLFDYKATEDFSKPVWRNGREVEGDNWFRSI